MGDPRAENCKAFSTTPDGKITGVELGITTIPNAKYEVYAVRLIDEASANGQTIATCTVLDKNGIPNGEQVRLTWAGSAPPFSDSGLSGSGNNVHVIVNGYNPPNKGPLAVHIGGFNTPTSDIVYGLGLPFKHHVSYNIVFREKGAITQPPVDSDLEYRVTELERRMENHEVRIKRLENPVGGGAYKLPATRWSVHWIAPTDKQSHKDYIKAMRPGVIKIVNGKREQLQFCLDNIDPNGIVVVRDHARSEQQDFLARDPIGCGHQHALEWKKDFDAGGKFAGMNSDRIVVCALNEPFVFGPPEEKKLNAYTKAFLEDLTRYGIRGLCLNLSVGWVRNSDDATHKNTPPTWEGFLDLEPIINNGGHILGLHEYWYDDPDEAWAKMPNGVAFGWKAFRHLACPMQVPIIIGECGLTKNVDQKRWENEGKPPTGWIGNKTPDQYAEQMQRYGRKCSPNVIGFMPFTTGSESADWDDDLTDTAHGSFLKYRETCKFPDNFPIDPPASNGIINPPIDPPITTDPKVLVLPKFTGRTSGFYGSIYTNKLGTYAHEGVDVAAPAGTPIYAPYDGIVAWSDVDPNYGEYVRTYHKDLNICFLFGHMSARMVNNNDKVKQGQLIGLSGNTGNSTGAHIHIDTRFMNKDSMTYRSNVSAHSNARIDLFGFIAGWEASGNRIVEK